MSDVDLPEVMESPRFRRIPYALYRFSRPHTIVGTSLSVFSLYILADLHLGSGRAALGALLLAWLSCLGANLWIVGLNQISDVDIDRINKPDLPLASGALTARQAWLIVCSSVLLSVIIALLEGPFLLLTVIVSLIIGTAYSLPPLRLKRFAFWAAASIFTVRGVVVNLFLYLHFHWTLSGGQVEVPAHIVVLTIFVFLLSLVIAWFKDIPDVDGDAHYQIATLSVTLGKERVFQLSQLLLVTAYGFIITAGWIGVTGVNRPFMVIAHLALLVLGLLLARRVDLARKASIRSYYLSIWGLFFAEYIVYPIAAWLAA